LSWNEAISHATSIPAEMTWLDRGYLKPGSPADLVVFEPDVFRDMATFGNPLTPPEGIRYVMVNGKIAVQEGKVREQPAGHFLRRK
nr:amidohydrolase family protein [Synergistales bacterium]